MSALPPYWGGCIPWGIKPAPPFSIVYWTSYLPPSGICLSCSGFLTCSGCVPGCVGGTCVASFPSSSCLCTLFPAVVPPHVTGAELDVGGAPPWAYVCGCWSCSSCCCCPSLLTLTTCTFARKSWQITLPQKFNLVKNSFQSCSLLVSMKAANSHYYAKDHIHYFARGDIMG